MRTINVDEEVPYFSITDTKDITERVGPTKDEEQQSTLRQVYAILKEGVANLRSFDAFDLTGTELAVKQQIKAHKMAADIVEPALDLVEQALKTVDQNFRERMEKQKK